MNKSNETVILEIRAGTGGEEAALFVSDLFKMYLKYAQSQSWEEKILDSHKSSLNGFKEIVFQIKGEGVFSKLRNEAGVHRVQRTPKTEKAGRVHTSTVSVAVLLKQKKTTFQMKHNDLKIDIFKSSGPGGQNVNKRETAIRITHIPTGIVASSQTQRTQPQNKENAMCILQAKLLKMETEKQSNIIKDERRGQIGQAKRAEKIRTYNFPQNRITDHRINKKWHNLDQIMNGRLDKIINKMQKID